jgi:ABC-type transporter Mla subunit MlaD
VTNWNKYETIRIAKRELVDEMSCLIKQAEEQIRKLQEAVHKASNDLTAKQLQLRDLHRELQRVTDEFNAGMVLLADAHKTLEALKVAVAAEKKHIVF